MDSSSPRGLTTSRREVPRPRRAQCDSSACRPWTAVPVQSRRRFRASASDEEIFGLWPFLLLRIALVSPLRALFAAFSIRPSRFAEEPAAAWAAPSLARMALVFARTTFASDGARSAGAAPLTAPSTAVSWVLIPAKPVASVWTQQPGVAGSRVSSVQTLPSSQLGAVPGWQVPDEQVSLPLQELPSSHPLSFRQEWRHRGCPSPSRAQMSRVFGLPSSQLGAGTATQMALRHALPAHWPNSGAQSVSEVQGRQPSVGVWTQTMLSQVSCVQAFWSLQSRSVWQQLGWT